MAMRDQAWMRGGNGLRSKYNILARDEGLLGPSDWSMISRGFTFLEDLERSLAPRKESTKFTHHVDRRQHHAKMLEVLQARTPRLETVSQQDVANNDT